MSSTVFPSFDTLYRQPLSGSAAAASQNDTPVRIATSEASFARGDTLLTTDAIVEAYARVVAAVTGEEEVAFRYSLPPASEAGIAIAALDNAEELGTGIDSKRACSINCYPASSNECLNVQTDFALEVLAHGETSSILQLPFIFRVELGNQIALGLSFYRHLVSDVIAGSILRSAAEYFVKRSYLRPLGISPHLVLSALNYPSLNRPPRLHEDLDEGYNEDGPALLHGAFMRRAKTNPDRPALDFLSSLPSGDSPASHDILNYAELDCLTDALAAFMRNRVPLEGRQPIIPGLMSSSVELYVSWLATLKTGFAFCPISPDAPTSQVLYQFQDVSASLVLSRGSEANALTGELDHGYDWIDVAAFIQQWRASPTTKSTVDYTQALDENDLAYVMYTSGSTGVPKGVKVSHLAATCTITSSSVYLTQRASQNPSRWFQFAAPTFDPSILEIFVTFSTGNTLCSAEREASLTDPEATITELQATVMMATPSMAAILNPDKVPTLNDLWAMGEPLNRKVIEGFSSDSPAYIERKAKTATDPSGVGLLNAYGPTEGTIICTLVADFSVTDRGSIIGKPLPTCSMFIMDPLLKIPTLMPLGFPGELIIGGPQVGTGYLNRPAETEKAFVFSDQYGKLYRTGDRAKIVEDRDGNFTIEILGRITMDQVKLSGRRVELGDIENVIARVEGIRDAVTVVHKPIGGGYGSEQVVGCVLPQLDADQVELASSCQAVAKQWLQPHMHPSKYFFLEQMPRSRNGKIDRKALVNLVEELWTKPDSDSTEEAEDDEILDERIQPMVLEGVADVCNVSGASIRLSAELLSYGFDSLRAMHFLQKAREARLRGLTVGDVVTCRTFRDLVIKYIESSKAEQQDTSVITDLASRAWKETVASFRDKHEANCSAYLNVSANDIEMILPTTATQSGMLASFLRSMVDTSLVKHYIHHSVYEVAAGHNIDAVGDAWVQVLQRCDAFRIVFDSVDDDLAPFAQCVLSPTCPLAQIVVKSYICRVENDHDKLVAKALGDAEASISLDKPPFSLAIVQSSSRSTVVLSLFHAIFDGGSLQLLVKDVEDQYHHWDSAPRTQVDVAVARHFQSDRQQAKNYWLQQLEGFTPSVFPSLSLSQPAFLPKSPSVSTVLAKSNMKDLLLASKASHISSLAVLQTAWSLILCAYTAKDDVVFGSVISDRYSQETADCLAPTFVTVPIRVSAGSAELTAVDIAKRITSQNSDALHNLHTPPNSLATSEGRLPYDTLIAFQSFSGAAKNSGLWTSIDYPPMGNDFATMIEVWPTENGQLLLKATYECKHLDDVAAETMLKQLDDAICFVLEHPTRPFLDGRFIGRQELLSASAEIVSPEDTNETMVLHSPFEKHAQESPESLALDFYYGCDDSAERVRWTYAELNERANNLALHLVKRLGSLKDRVVPICMEKCPELYVAILGIVKAGGAWCPIHPDFPPRRRHDLIERTDATLVLVAHATEELDPASVPQGVETLDITGCLPAPEESSALPTVEPENLAYLIFTSGTTGPPKGVPIGHKAAASAMRSLSKTIPYDTKTGVVRFLQFAQYTFDVFVQDLFYTWRIGGTVVSSSSDLMLDSFVRLSNFTRVTHAHLTPAFGSAVSREEIETLEVITMIGEKLTQPVADDWGTNMRGYNTYGPAEAAVVSTVQEFGPNPEHIKSSNVGVPLETVGAYVIQDGRVVMRNAIGELALAGDQLSQGYWKDADKSAEKFIMSESLGRTLYLTGDLVRQLGDGSIDFVGRDDDLVKIGGQRVELSEIAYFLRSSHPAVQQVEVLYLESQKRAGKMIVAFLSVPVFDNAVAKFTPVTTSEATKLIETARDSARRLLPGHMIPDVFIVLPKMPRTPSAKVDRHVLKQICCDFEASLVDEVAADELDDDWRETNPVLVDVIAQTTGVSKGSIKPNGSLVALGIDSLGAIRLAAKMNSCNYTLSVLDVLRCKTISDIATFTSLKQSRKALQQGMQDFHREWYETVAEYLQTRDLRVAPASFLQESLLGESMRNPETYWSNHFFELDAKIDLERLRDAWHHLVAETEALRAGFIPIAAIANPPASKNPNSTFLQVIYDDAEVDWKIREVQSETIASKAKNVAATIAQQRQSAFFRNSPWAVTILQDGGSRTMMLTIHHSLHDGPALDYMLADLGAKYNGSSIKPRCHLLEALAIAKSETSSEDVDAFWRKELQNFAAEDVIKPESPQASAEAAKQTKMRSHEIVLETSKQELQSAARRLCANSMNTLIRTACGFSLAELLEVQNVVFAEVLSDRIIDSKLQEAVAPLISVVPVPFSATGNTKDLVAEQSRISRATWEHRHVRPATVRQIIRRPQDQALYPAVFVFHPEGHADAETPPVPWKALDDLVGLNVEHTIAFNVWQNTEQKIVLEFSAADDIMTRQHQEIFVRQIDALLAAMVEHPESPIADLPDFFPVELRSVTPRRPNTTCPADYDPTWWVEHWAQTHPDWKAVEVATQTWPDIVSSSWTYKELDDYGNRVAASIRKQGVVNGTVAICLSRTLEAFGIIHGILKSGNTYLPLEESLPNERKVFLVQDSGASVLFTTSELFETPDDFHAKVFDVESSEFCTELDSFSSETVPVEYQRHAPAYILYTSGSTGKPKGVLVSRQNLASFMQAQSEFICEVVPTTPSLAGTGKYLNLASRAFDVHIGEMFLAWRHGLTAVTAKRALLLDDLGAALKNLKVTHASFVPSLLDQAGLTPDDAPDLHFLGVGGEKMTEKTRKLWGGHDRVGLINAYGPTEVTVGCCSGRLLPNSDPRSIGSPLGDSIGHVLRPGTEHYVKRMMPGELCFSGDLVAIGYLNRPDAQGFVEDFNGVRMYRTGDIVRLMPDNSIEFIGRKDDQVKIRGQRVELGEISEGVRTSSPDAIDVATLVLKHKELSRQQLVAFVARSTKATKAKNKQLAFLDEEFDSINAQLRPTCQKILPAHMVPDLIFPVTSIPLTQTSAKADVKLLGALFSSVPVSRLMAGAQKPGVASTSSNRPMTTEEQQIAEVLKTIVNNESVEMRPDTSIFELGIDSLSAISLFMKLKEIGYECSVANVLTHPMVEQLAQLPRKEAGGSNINKTRQELAQVDAEYRADPTVPVPSNLVQVVRPCLPLQEVMVARSIDSGDGADSFYVNHIMLEIACAVDISRFCKAWKDTVTENEILRTCFWFSGDHFRQVVLEPEACNIEWNSVRAQDQTPIQALLEKEYPRIRTDIVQNISCQPPIRFTFGVSQGGQRSTLLVSVHHALYDAESLHMLFQEVHRRYDGVVAEPRPSLNSLLEYIGSRDKENTKKHWQSLLKNWEQTRLIAQPDQTEGPEQAKAVILKPKALGTSLSALEATASRLKLTAAAVMQTAFGTALAQMLGTNDVIFGSVLSGRAVPVKEVENILVPCITTIPQRVNLRSSGPTLLDACNAFQNLSYESLEYQHSSARDIQAWVGADRPLFDSLFSFIRPRGKPFDFKLWKEIESDMPMDSSLAVEVEADSATDQLMIGVGCTPSFGDAAKANELLEKIEMLVDAILGGEHLSLADIGISTEASSEVAARTIWDESTWSEQEEEVRRLVAGFAQVSPDNVRKNTSFLHIGIDSITAIRFARTLRENGYNVSSADVMRNSCIGALCDSFKMSAPKKTEIAAGQGATVEPEQSAVDVPADLDLLDGDSVEAIYHCTPLQVGMLTQTLGIDGRLYVHHHALHLEAGTDATRWKEAWYKTVQQLDVLRTSFHTSASQWIAVVHGKELCPWNEVQTDGFKSALQGLQDTTIFTEASQFGQPPVKATLFTDSSSSILFVVSMHHALYDGMSVPLIFQQLTDNYLQLPISASTPFYKAAQMMHTNKEAAVTHWSSKLEGYRSINIPLTEEEQSSERLNLASITAAVGGSGIGFSLQTIALLAFTKTLSCLVERRDVAFGVVLAGRNLQLENADTIIGPTFNTVPYRVRLANPLSPNQHELEKLQQQMLDGIEFQHASFVDVQNRWRQAAGDATLTDSLFVFQKVNSGRESVSRGLWRPYETEEVSIPSEYSLNFEVEQNDSGLVANAYSKLGKARLEAFLQMFGDAVQDIVANPGRFVTAFPSPLRGLLLESGTKEAEAISWDDIAVQHYAEPIRHAMAQVVNISVEKIDLSTNIFSIGLDSIAAIQVASRCRRSAHIRISVADIIQGVTLGRICKVVYEANKDDDTVAQLTAPLVRPEDQASAIAHLGVDENNVEEVLPVLAGQDYHLAGWLASGRTMYEPTWAFNPTARLDEERLHQAWHKLQERHSIMRTAFAAIKPEQAFQVVMKPSAILDGTFTVQATATDLTETAKEHIRQEARKPSTLFTPPIRLHLIHSAEEGDAVLITMHHTTYDAWTMSRLVADLTALYSGQALSAEPPSFSSFVHHTHSTQRAHDQKAFWQTTLAPYSTPTLLTCKSAFSPTNPTTSQHQTFRMRRTRTIDLARADAAARAAGRHTPALLVVAFARALGRASGATSPVFGLYGLGRAGAFARVEDVSGPAVNVLPMGVAEARGRGAGALADEVQRALAARMPFEQSQLRDVVGWVGAGKPLFNACLNLLWRDELVVLGTGGADTDEGTQPPPPLLRPWALGVPTDFAAEVAVEGGTAVDALERRFLSSENLFVDLGPDWEGNAIRFGARADRALLDEEGMEWFLGLLEEEIGGVAGEMME
ncbi:uncharacterized protein K452DRAFT_361401 [Aplosporella prunicola CBS 121167]|uniref:Carrier domain-containing protein n=1 Tax=Aplosporella prunicola CBS 121167 TaxID=1176127 RepID=A0A6A6B3E8_9PEZI|nr:uncharacterized protein K452DRAFT_361401 [Aplosporella prunicola CBS 121167]KAF2138336.1 hypothetical protein K452DRAFT_361401 [Aplosporella prunicola CBS 121167]